MTNTISIIDSGTSKADGQAGQDIITGTPTTNSSVETITTGAGQVIAELSGVWTGTIQFEASSDGGATYNPVDAVVKGVEDVVQRVTGNGSFQIAAATNQRVRARAVAAMTGAATVGFTGSTANDVQHVIVVNPGDITIGSFEGVDAEGADITGDPVLAGQRVGGKAYARRGNENAAATLIVLAAAVQATLHSADQVNLNGRGVKVVADLTTTTTASVVFTIEGKDAVSGKYYTILQSAAKVANGTTVMTVYPGIAAQANLSASDVLPATWRVSAAITDNAGTAAVTGTIGASVIV